MICRHYGNSADLIENHAVSDSEEYTWYHVEYNADYGEDDHLDDYEGCHHGVDQGVE